MTTASNHVGDHGTATASSGAATCHHVTCQITSESLSTAAGALYTLTVTDKVVQSDSVVIATVNFGTASTGIPEIAHITPTAGQVVINVKNGHASAAFNGTIVISFVVL